jgi:hypothetical protein
MTDVVLSAGLSSIVMLFPPDGEAGPPIEETMP